MRRATFALLFATAGANGVDTAAVFRFVFVAAVVFLVAALVAVLRMEELPLRGPAVKAPPSLRRRRPRRRNEQEPFHQFL